jgi:hypothetical protein
MRYSDLYETKVVSALWFRHESPLDLSILRPLTYDELRYTRPDYDVDARMETELSYRKLVSQKPGTSFLYATISGFNKMEDPESYPGFTYYFQLTNEQIERCLFGIVDKEHALTPQLGSKALHIAIELWISNEQNMSSYEEPGLGIVDPRVEVIIPFEVQPTSYVPQREDR